MKSTIKIVLAVALFTSVSFADGEMGTGNRNCQGTCLIDTQTTSTTTKDTIQKVEEGDILVFVKQFLTKIFG